MPIGLLVFGLVIAIGSLVNVQAVAEALIFPGSFVVAKLAGAPCSARHLAVCSFWDADLQYLNGGPLILVGLLLDWFCYSGLVWMVWTAGRRL